MSSGVTYEEWINGCKKARSDILEMEQGDRLINLSYLLYMTSVMKNSIEGWQSWFKNPHLMSNFTEEEISELFELMKELSLTLLDNDISLTEKKVEELYEKLEEDLLEFEEPEMGFIS